MEKYIVIDLIDFDTDKISSILGKNDENINFISDYLDTPLSFENNKIYAYQTDKKEVLIDLFNRISSVYDLNDSISKQDINALIVNDAQINFFKQKIATGINSKQFYLRSIGQKRLYESFFSHDITIAYGPAGSGKTFLACVYALNQLKANKVSKIVITRPVVEAGESLGYLPGDLKEKIDPYLRPIYDCIEMIVGTGNITKMLEKGSLEIAPLAYMRGRTLNDSVVILDEAQNTTITQMKMFLTRLGFNSKMIITGDISQVDLPTNKISGLIDCIETLKDIDEIAICQMSNKDVVRHPVVSKIIDAYQKQ